ncbi:hypothetical protein DYB38_007416 [Aphanomyces astaci]|uniref:isoleucine--tRNA ligase n=1 Tax=Aphanomyces astaci TaxID=112090 RepID=A0A397DKH4_APHAT|nr:hypothetical protein DYB38_007416 [Aphanomyces astaci]
MVKAPTKQASVVGDVVRKTLNLPKTDFPMRANATVREPQLHARTVTELYATQEKQRKGVSPTFFLHDGPPFANGSLHTGHFLNRVLKDIINRYKLQRGYHVHYVPGWDCHGLPIEIKALEKLKLPRDKVRTLYPSSSYHETCQLDPIDIRKHSRALALDAVESQKKDLMRWGVLADWSGGKGTRYLTMDPDYEVRQYDVFKSMVKDGLIVQGYKPVYWSPSSGTALAESELEYQDDHVSSSAYVRFPVKSASAALAAFPNVNDLISMARSDLEYAIVEVAPGQLDLVAVALVDAYKATLNQPVQTVATVWGADLVGSIFSHPLNGQDSIGCYTAEAGTDLAGLFVQTQGTAKVLEQLAQSGALVSVSEITHRFPYDWRTKKPILLRATKQWFAKLDSLHALGHQDTLEPLLNDTTISHVQKVMLEHGGTDAWWTQPLATLLAPGFDPAQYVKGTDTLDVWFDSGSSWYAVLPKDTVADVYLEGSDQHRGWFQSSLLTSLAVQRKAPYKNVITHGFILDERGQKMSKSLGNVLVPHDIIEGHPKKKIPAYGVDTLRYWVASTDYTSQVGIGPSTMVKISDHVRKVRNTARFLLANLNDFDPRVDAVAYDDMTSLDQYMLHLLHELQAQITDGLVDFLNFEMKASKEGWEQVLDAALQTITTAIAPVVCHTAEDIRLHRLAQFTNAIVNDVPGSVFLDGWFSPKIHADGELAAILNQVNPRILEDMLLCSGVTLHALDATTTGETTLVLEKFPVKVVVRPAQGHKCPRCWKFANEVNEAQETLCARCASAVGCSRIHDLVHK